MTSRASEDAATAARPPAVQRTPLAGLPYFVPLTIAVLLTGIRDGMTLPYVTLFAVERAHLAPLQLGVFLTLRSVGAVLISMALGAWFDRKPSVVPLTLTLLVGSLGNVLLAFTTDFRLLLVVATLLLGTAGATFPQLFALARGHLDWTDKATAERGVSLLRAGFSVAWAIGPAIGALTVELADYRGLFLGSAAFGLVAYGAIHWRRLGAPERAARPPSIASARLAVVAVAISFTLFSMAMAMGAVALPIVVVQDLHGTRSAVGLISSLCALLEVPVMVAVAWRPRLLGGFGAIATGFLAFTLYFLTALWGPSVGVMFGAQLLRAVGIGFVTCAGISYMQDLMPGRTGAAAALYSNTGQVGAMLAGLSAGIWADQFGFRSMFLACTALTVIGLGFLGADRLRHQ